MNAAYHPVAIPEWSRDHRKLPAHTLCLSHVRDSRGKRRCLAVPEAEATKYLAELERFSAVIANVAARHAQAEARRLATPAKHPAYKIPKRPKSLIPATKMHRHRMAGKYPPMTTNACLTPIDVPGEADWYSCSGAAKTHPGLAGAYNEHKAANGYVHVHRTKRGRAFLVRHLQGEASCPATIARKAEEARDAALPCPNAEECGHRKGDHRLIYARDDADGVHRIEQWRCDAEESKGSPHAFCQCGRLR